MTRRILASFLAVLVAVIAAVVVPLGLTVTAQQRRDFRDGTRGTARALASLAEEWLDDKRHDPSLPRLLAQAAGRDDAVLILDTTGAIVARAGGTLPVDEVAAASTGAVPEHTGDNDVVTAVVGDPDQPVGRVVLSRDTAPLESRTETLWLALAGAGAAAIVIGGMVGWSLARWIAAPLRSLIGAAHGIGSGKSGARADDSAGPPEVRDVATAFNDMADRVGSLLQAQRGMTADVSHQLRTPLTALRLRLELLPDGHDGELGKEITAMLAETDRLSRLVDGLLTVARAEAAISAPAATDVAEISADRIAAWTAVANEHGIAMSLDARPAVAAITPGHLEQILDNLIANAIDAVPPGGHVNVTVSPDADGVVLRVIDSGPGMGAEQRAHAFGRFVTDRGAHGGSGLGLAIVGRLVAADHGSAALLPTPGGGLTAQLRLASPSHREPRHAGPASGPGRAVSRPGHPQP